MAKAKEKLVEEAKADVQVDRVKVLEDLLAEVQPALHRFRKQIPNTAIAIDANRLYQQVRDTLGAVGKEIDKVLRG